MEFVEPIRDPDMVKCIGEYLKNKDEKLFVMYSIGIYSGLRISDILSLKIKDVKGKAEIRLKEKKTGKIRSFAINPKLKKIIKAYCEDKNTQDYLIPNKRDKGRKAISREYAYRILREAGEHFNIEHIGTHTLRKTFGYHFYLQNNDIVLLMKILNHSDQSKTLRYIGIEQTTMNEAIRKLHY